MSNVTIYHNPDCSKSREVLALIRARGIEPRVIEYLKQPPDRAALVSLIEALGIPVISLLRTNEPVYAELGLDHKHLSDAELIDAMLHYPVLINRPIVISGKGVRLCRPPERVLELLS